MKYLALLVAVLVTPSVFAQAHPQCQLADSDLDGDGWGYENGSSCIATEVPASQCIDSPPLGNGWGWNGTQSCQLGEVDTTVVTSTKPVCQFPGIADPDGDGFGWENGASCVVSESTPQPDATNIWAQVLKGKWNCQPRFPHLGGYREYASGAFAQTTIESWQTYPQYCPRGCGIYGSYKNVTFADSSAVIESFQSHQPGENTWLGSETVEWSLSNFIFSLDGVAQQKFAFENYLGSEYFHYYQSDTSRVTCKRL